MVKPIVPRGLDGRFVSGPVGWAWMGLDRLAASTAAKVEEIEQARRDGAEKLARDALAYMQANAPWKDRSGEARRSMIAVAVHDEDRNVSVVNLAYGVWYGLMLEYETFGGKSYAILRPTVDYFRGKVADYLK